MRLQYGGRPDSGAIPYGFSSDLRTSSGHGFDFWVGGSKRLSLTHGPSYERRTPTA